MDLTEVIAETLEKNLKDLSWECTNCPQIDVCENQANGGEERY